MNHIIIAQLKADTGMQGHLQASTSLPSTYANHQGSKILSSGNKNPETIGIDNTTLGIINAGFQCDLF